MKALLSFLHLGMHGFVRDGSCRVLREPGWLAFACEMLLFEVRGGRFPEGTMGQEQDVSLPLCFQKIPSVRRLGVGHTRCLCKVGILLESTLSIIPGGSFFCCPFTVEFSILLSKYFP